LFEVAIDFNNIDFATIFENEENMNFRIKENSPCKNSGTKDLGYKTISYEIDIGFTGIIE